MSMNIGSSTDALSWLLSLSATCTSSPFRSSSPDDTNSFTDWLHLSPSRIDTDSSLSTSIDSSTIPDYLALSPSRSPFNDFGSYLNFYVPSAPLPSFSDISPIVRADHNKAEDLLLIDKENEVPKKRKKKSKTRDSIKPSSAFLEKLQAATPSIQQPPNSLRATSLNLPDGSSARPLVLLSPVKLSNSEISYSQQGQSTIPAPIFTTPPRPSGSSNASLSLLSPLTPLSSADPSPLKIKIVLKRRNTDPTTPSSKKPRRTRDLVINPSSPLVQQNNDVLPPQSEEQRLQDEIHYPVYTNRTMPPNIKICSALPLLYRKFPASSYYQPPGADSPCSLFSLTNPGGIYNPPRRVFDLYTPRFVKGKGAEKVGLCPICVEPFTRGGENKRLWLAMKFSAFKYYHMQYAHGISASTGKPLSPPTAFRVVPRQNPGKNEKHHIQEGKCHKCSKWVVVEGVKDMESKVPELYWWKHAAACHHDSTLEGEGDYFEHDDVFTKLISFEQPNA